MELKDYRTYAIKNKDGQYLRRYSFGHIEDAKLTNLTQAKRRLTLWCNQQQNLTERPVIVELSLFEEKEIKY